MLNIIEVAMSLQHHITIKLSKKGKKKCNTYITFPILYYKLNR